MISFYVHLPNSFTFLVNVNLNQLPAVRYAMKNLFFPAIADATKSLLHCNSQIYGRLHKSLKKLVNTQLLYSMLRNVANQTKQPSNQPFSQPSKYLPKEDINTRAFI